jgi:hypothetical protein
VCGLPLEIGVASLITPRRRTMASWLIAFIGVVYSVVAINLLVTGKVGLGIAFIGYAIGNIGLFMEARL